MSMSPILAMSVSVNWCMNAKKMSVCLDPRVLRPSLPISLRPQGYMEKSDAQHPLQKGSDDAASDLCVQQCDHACFIFVAFVSILCMLRGKHRSPRRGNLSMGLHAWNEKKVPLIIWWCKMSAGCLVTGHRGDAFVCMTRKHVQLWCE